MIYDAVRGLGVEDENIILLIPENSACNPRNNDPGIVCPVDEQSEPNLFKNAEIDYKSADVSVKTLSNMLRGRYTKFTPRSKRLVTNKNTKILTFFTGHGGDGYLKMQDTDFVLDEQFDEILQESYIKNLYKEMLMINDSCSASTIFDKLTAPNIFGLGSSSFGQKSYSSGFDENLSVSKSDQLSQITYYYLKKNLMKNKELTLADLMTEFPSSVLKGDIGYKNTNPKKDQSKEIKVFIEVEEQNNVCKKIENFFIPHEKPKQFKREIRGIPNGLIGFDNIVDLPENKDHIINKVDFWYYQDMIMCLMTTYLLSNGEKKCLQSFGSNNRVQMKHVELKLYGTEYISNIEGLQGQKQIEYLKLTTSKGKFIEVGSDLNQGRCKKFELPIKTNEIVISFLGNIDKPYLQIEQKCKDHIKNNQQQLQQHQEQKQQQQLYSLDIFSQLQLLNPHNLLRINPDHFQEQLVIIN
ncbi:phosphatidylinositol glycan, putative [Ichthyophthirius multifiliis]|uniref:Phosphatidylinositol glycan, putative n=1 Tax=Ichthyophthirius multifiliis TaxID=5932 RepID=G0R2Y6_ICHMU|nr:phosphatidylinositol glycan, putative [Ichthyophthirius multifiliis]EGR28170.1 phosphatidylinositol glycan, putative [Ichthyophthirius multifiliis]|eukprot:XP_004027515.1 phosphatidylinositol glycan, putative [Ichthyophthirius multifiliis]